MSRTKKEIGRFLVAGCCAVGTDMGTYYALLPFLPHSPSKAASFLCGTVVAYVINKYWTFEQRRKSHVEMAKFGILYLSTLGANVGVNKVSLKALPGQVLLAFLAATATSTVLNFLGQKYWVFARGSA